MKKVIIVGAKISATQKERIAKALKNEVLKNEVLTLDKGNAVTLAGLEDKEYNAIMAVLSNDAKKERQMLIKTERTEIKEEYRGFFHVFNFVKSETKLFKSIKDKSKDFKASFILGTMNLNQFISLMKNGLRYNTDQVHKYAESYEMEEIPVRMQIAEKGETINALLVQYRNEEISAAEAVNAFIKLMGQPVKIAKNGLKTSTVSKTSAEFLFNEVVGVFSALKLGEKYPEIVNPAPVETEGVEMVETVADGLAA